MDIDHNQNLSFIDLELLASTGEEVQFDHNPLLTSFDLSSLVEVGEDLRVHDNPALPDCLVALLVAQVTVPGIIVTDGNKTNCVCAGEPALATCP